MIHRILSVDHPEGLSTTARDLESPLMASVSASFGIITRNPSLGFRPVPRCVPRLMSPRGRNGLCREDYSSSPEVGSEVLFLFFSLVCFLTSRRAALSFSTSKDSEEFFEFDESEGCFDGSLESDFAQRTRTPPMIDIPMMMNGTSILPVSLFWSSSAGCHSSERRNPRQGRFLGFS